MQDLLLHPLALPLLLTAVFLTTSGLTLALTAPMPKPAARLAQYAQAARRTSPGAAIEGLTLGQRVLAPLIQKLVEQVARRTPSHVHRAVAAELSMAGARISPIAFATVRLLLMVGLPVLAAGFALGPGSGEPAAWILFVLALVWGRKLPGFWLKRRIRSRQRAIDRGLPYSLDLMVACLEGGLSLDAALAKVVEQSAGPLAMEIRKTLQELALGRPSTEAIRDLGERTGAPDLKRLCEDIIQSDRMGVSIASSLRALAHESRIQRRQKAEEAARKAPIKMVPVLIFCVLPSLGIVTTAPAALLLLRALSQSTGT